MSILVTGSFAYDTIMVFHDRFKNHILPDQVHILNVCFLVPDIRKEFGGCAGNIAYNLRLLGVDAVPMGTVGSDFTPYRDQLKKKGIRDDCITEISGTYTAQAFLTTDMDDNQIIAFHPGAMNQAHMNKVNDASGITLGIVAPDGRDAMIEHAEQFTEAGIPFIFDPGQGLPMFDGAELNTFIEQADYVVVNDYESQMMQEKTQRSIDQLAKQVKAFVVTRGGKGSRIHVNGNVIEIPVAKIGPAEDPTGCGDAYRSGLLYGIFHDLDWQTTGRIASLMGAIKIEYHGTQNHSVDSTQIEQRYRESFGSDFSLGKRV